MEGYSFDYTHGRRNLGEALHIIKRGYWFPKLSWWHSYEYAKDRVVGSGNVRNEVLSQVETASPDYAREYRPLLAEENALRQIVLLCKAYGIGVIISSYVFFDHNGTQRNLKLQEGVHLENKMFRKIADEQNCRFVDVAEAFPLQSENFVDAVHFAPRGMTIVANRISAALVAELELQRQNNRMPA
jgi:hypothetical protein